LHASNRSSRAALIAFCVLAAGSIPLYLVLGRHWWFYLDEWNLLASRSGRSVNDLLRPYNQHWITLPILAWRALWTIVGARSYLPYQAMSVLLHVVVAALIRSVMRHAGVRPWIATIGAGAFLFFGAGAQNILSAFQITFTGAIAFGFVQLMLTDHEGEWSRRDWIALAAGLCALMCSGAAVAMVGVVGVATWLRRGRRVAVAQITPLAAIYAAWYLRYGRSGAQIEGSIGGAVGFVRDGVGATFENVGQLAGVGALLGLALALGVVVLVRSGDAPARHAQVALVGAFLVGLLMFFAAAAVGRNRGQAVVDLPTQSRYLYVGAAMLAPVFGIAAESLTRRARVLGALAIVPLLIGVPGNVIQASEFARAQAQHVAGTRSVLLSVARSTLSEQVPGTLRPDPVGAPLVTMAWLRAEQRVGRIPELREPNAQLLAANRLRLELMELDTPSIHKCRPLTHPVVRHLQRGQQIGIGDGAVTVRQLSTTGATVTFGNVLFRSSSQAHTLVSDFGDLAVRVAPLRGHRAQLC